MTSLTFWGFELSSVTHIVHQRVHALWGVIKDFGPIFSEFL